VPRVTMTRARKLALYFLEFYLVLLFLLILYRFLIVK
jgi:hypothetical protein